MIIHASLIAPWRGDPRLLSFFDVRLFVEDKSLGTVVVLCGFGFACAVHFGDC